jgi:hypothetical protein
VIAKPALIAPRDAKTKKEKAMRMIFATPLILAATITLPVTSPAQDEEDETGINETTADDFEAIGWNRWRCIAREQGIWWSRTYVGHSHYFQQGSGEGVQGQNIARLIALRECEFNQARRTWGQRGFCQVDQCQVDRF